MADENAPAVDLLGDPWTLAVRQRGRKAHRRDAQLAEKIAVLRSTGAKVEEIALRIGLSDKTLKKYYSRELDDGPQLARAVLIETMWAKALGGNVSAARFIREEFPRGDAESYLRRSREPLPRQAPRPGKKEEADIAATSAGEGTIWGDDLKPPTVN